MSEHPHKHGVMVAMLMASEIATLNDMARGPGLGSGMGSGGKKVMTHWLVQIFQKKWISGYGNGYDRSIHQ